MSRHRLFVDEPLAADSELELHGDRAHYLGRVLRCRPGDRISLFDGSGAEYASRIDAIGKHNVRLAVGAGAQPATESTLDFRLLQCVSRGERMDLVVQKATELGARSILPLQSEFSVVHLSAERAGKRVAHWQRIANNAAEQCGRVVPATIEAPQHLDTVLAAPAAAGSTRLMLDPAAGGSLTNLAPARHVELLIGPEGGLSNAERERASQAGFHSLALGPRVLRTETAAIAMLAVLQFLWGDLGNR